MPRKKPVKPTPMVKKKRSTKKARRKSTKQVAPPEQPSGHEISRTELVMFTGWSPQYIQSLEKQQVIPPGRMRGRNKVYPCPELWNRLSEFMREQGRKDRKAGGSSDADRRLAAQADMEELKVLERKGELVAVTTFRAELLEMTARVRAQLVNAIGAWPPRLVGAKSIGDAKGRLEPLIHDIIADLQTVPQDD